MKSQLRDSQLFVCQEVTGIFVQPIFYMKPQNFSQMSQISRGCYQMKVAQKHLTNTDKYGDFIF